jgi:hypothetical protein
MIQWMGEPEMRVQVMTDWTVGGPLVVRGIHNDAEFEGRGTVLAFEPPRLLRYDQLSSVSRLPQVPENCSELEFRLEDLGDRTRLTLGISRFPTETIFKHLAFYWRGTLGIFKAFAESRARARTAMLRG